MVEADRARQQVVGREGELAVVEVDLEAFAGWVVDDGVGVMSSDLTSKRSASRLHTSRD